MRGVKTKKQESWKRLSLSVFLLFILIILLNSTYKVYKKKKSAEELLSRMQEETLTLEQRQKSLEESLYRLDTTEGIKLEMRKKLNVAEAGESVAIIVDPEDISKPKPAEISPWQKFKDFWINLF